MTPGQLERLVERHGTRDRAILLRLVALLLRLWRPFDGWYDEDRVLAHAARSASLVDGATLQTYLLAREYVRQGALLSGRPVPELPPADPRYPRANTTALEVYTRPAEQYRYAASVDDALDEALDAALERAEALADLDLGASRRQGFADALQASQATAYRRVIHPELSAGGTCGLCVAASTRVYRVEDLQPIHGRCKCTVAEIAGDSDPGDLLNGIDLERLYGAAGSTAAEDLKRTRYRVDEHGELGPVLVADGERETEAHRRAREAKNPRHVEPGPQQWRAELDTLTDSERRLAARAARGDDVLTPLQWQRDRIADLTARLARAA